MTSRMVVWLGPGRRGQGLGVVGGVWGRGQVSGFPFQGDANELVNDMPRDVNRSYINVTGATVPQTHVNGSVSTILRSNSIGNVPHLRINNLNCSSYPSL